MFVNPPRKRKSGPFILRICARPSRPRRRSTPSLARIIPSLAGGDRRVGVGNVGLAGSDASEARFGRIGVRAKETVYVKKGVDVFELAQIDANSSRYRDLVEFRRRILRTPLGLDFTPEQLAKEQADIHIAAYLDGELVGCVVLTAVDGSQGSVVKLRQMAVDLDRQGRGIGAQIIAFAEKLAAERGYREIILHARETATPFYERAGYVPTGETFTEVTITHRKMVKRLAAPG